MAVLRKKLRGEQNEESGEQKLPLGREPKLVMGNLLSQIKLENSQQHECTHAQFCVPYVFIKCIIRLEKVCIF